MMTKITVPIGMPLRKQMVVWLREHGLDAKTARRFTINNVNALDDSVYETYMEIWNLFADEYDIFTGERKEPSTRNIQEMVEA